MRAIIRRHQGPFSIHFPYCVSLDDPSVPPLMVHPDLVEGLSLFSHHFYRLFTSHHPLKQDECLRANDASFFSICRNCLSCERRFDFFENLSLNRSWYLNPVNFPEILAPHLNVPRAILAEIFRRQKFTSPQNFEKFQAWENWIGDRFHHHLLRRGWADACTAGLPAGKQWLYFHIIHYAIRQNYIYIIVTERLTVNWCSFKSDNKFDQYYWILRDCCL